MSRRPNVITVWTTSSVPGTSATKPTEHWYNAWGPISGSAAPPIAYLPCMPPMARWRGGRRFPSRSNICRHIMRRSCRSCSTTCHWTRTSRTSRCRIISPVSSRPAIPMALTCLVGRASLRVADSMWIARLTACMKGGIWMVSFAGCTANPGGNFPHCPNDVSPPGRRCRGLAFDQAVLHQLVAVDSGQSFLATADLLEDQAYGRAAHGRDRLADRGQGRPDGRCHRRVVETGDGDVFGDAQAHAVGDGDRGGGHVVVAGEYGRGPVRQLQQLLRGDQTGAIGEHALGHVRFRDLDVRRMQGVEEGLAAQGGRRVPGVAHDQADAAVAQFEQVSGHRARALVVVDADRRGVFGGRSGGNGHDGHVSIVEAVDGPCRIT